MNLQARRAVGYALLLTCFMTIPAAAQSTRDEWLALRTRKQARHHRLPSLATQPNAFTITTIRFFSDATGNLVGVGEARNDTPFDLSYSRINFRFLDSSGAELGREWTYVLGGVNAQLVITNAYETLLIPGATGFFKIWTTIPAHAMASYTAESAGENQPYTNPRATLGSPTTRPDIWVPLVFTRDYRRPVVEQRLSGWVINDDPQGPGCLCGHPKIFASSVLVSMAAYHEGVIADVQSVFATGPRRTAQCSTPQMTGLHYAESAPFTIDFARPGESIGRHAVEWDENERPATVSPLWSGLFEASGGEGTFTIDPWCEPTNVTSDPWIRVLEGTPSGVRIAVDSHSGPNSRHGSVTVRGASIQVGQWPPCRQGASTKILGPHRVNNVLVTINRPICLSATASSADWLRVAVNSSEVRASAEPNLTGTTRTAVVTAGQETFTLHQSPASRSLDFNNDGKLDLLWHHRRDGLVAAWWMNGLEITGGTVISAVTAWDNLLPAAVADLDCNGTSDLVLQNLGSGPLGWWRLSGATIVERRSIQNMPDSTQWKLRSAADFNHDGDPDLVWQHDGTGQIQLWLMRSGTVTDSIWGATVSQPQAVAAVPLGPGQVADLNWKIVGSGDFNRDGSPDVVWQHQADGRVAVWKMTGTGFSEAAPLGSGRIADRDWSIRAIGDLNGDDWPDVIWQHRVDGRVAAWLMNGTTLASAVVIAQLADTSWEIVGPR